MSLNKLYQQGIKTGPFFACINFIQENCFNKHSLKKRFTKSSVFLLILLLSCSITPNLSAQQLGGIIGLMPMQYNSSFAGSTGGTRISLITQSTKENNFWSDKYGNMALSYDKFIPAIGSGLGVYVSGFRGRSQIEEDKIRSGSFETGMALAPKFSIRGKYTFSPSVGFQYNHMNYMERNSFVLPIYDTISHAYNLEIIDYKDNVNSDLFKLSGSLLFNSRKFYAGISYFYTLNKRIETGHRGYRFARFYNQYERNDNFLYFQTGYKFQRRDNSNFSLCPQLLIAWYYVDKLKYNKFFGEFNLTARYKKVMLGLAGGDNSKLQALIGYQADSFRITFSHNFLFTSQYNIGELSLRYIISSKEMSNLGIIN